MNNLLAYFFVFSQKSCPCFHFQKWEVCLQTHNAEDMLSTVYHQVILLTCLPKCPFMSHALSNLRSDKTKKSRIHKGCLIYVEKIR